MAFPLLSTSPGHICRDLDSPHPGTHLSEARKKNAMCVLDLAKTRVGHYDQGL